MTPTFSRETLSRGDGQIFSASFAQQHAWILDQLMPESAPNTLSVTVHLRQVLSTQTFERSLNALVQRHEALRTTFQVKENQPLQVIAPSLSIPLPVVDLRALPEEERQAEVQRQVGQEARRPFELGQGPLMRAGLLQLAAEEHVLLLSMHRSVCDRWSLGLLLRELADLYEAFASGQPSSLPELPLQYAEFALRQQAWLQGEAAAAELAYWKQQLADSPAGQNLPGDRPRLPVPTWQGSTHSLALPGTLSEALRELSRREGVSMEMTLVAALQCLLYRYTGQEDLVIGTVAAGRRRGECEALIGLFENMLVLRTDLSGDLPFRELLERVREAVLGAQAHQELPFEYLVKELHPARALGQNPFFQVMLTLAPPPPALPPGWALSQLEVGVGTSRFDLSLDIQERAEGLLARFEYSRDLFDEATIARLAGHWQRLLEGIVADPAQPIASLPLLTEQEHHQLLVEWNTPQVEYFQDRCVHELFEAQVERTPEAVAVVCEGERLTYGELNRRANQLAHYLHQLGVRAEVGKEVPVGICVERSLEMVVGLLGILKAGGVHIPMDPTYPAERIAFMAEDTGMPVLLTQQHLLAWFPESHPQLVCLDADWPAISQQPATNPVHVVKGEHLAYVVYTSGSTGRPKGVLIEHQAIAAHCGAIIQAQELSADDCTLQFNSFTFDASLEQILPPLLVGARLVLRGPEVWSPADLLYRVKEHQLTVITVPCDYWHEVISEWATAPQQLSGQRLRLVIAGGDRLPPEAVQLWRQSPLRSARLFNVYGPTEATITTTIFDIPRHVEREQPGASIPIGRPLPNRTIYILDKAGQPVPEGVAGELHIGGKSLARGYLNHPELTAQRFIADPFSQQPQARLYKTGDLVRYLPGGIIEFLGRADHQVKIRGFRVELGEIEAAIKLHPAVHQTLVVVREDAPGVKRLVAYVVPQPAQETSQLVAQLRGLLKERLPDYMIPVAFVLLESFPLNAGGKFDRHALPVPDFTDTERQERFVTPRTLLEKIVAGIWAEVLGIKQVSIHDDFFALGGHSLLAMRLFDRIGQVCGKKLPLSTLFAGATVEHLAKVLQEEPGAAVPGEAKTDALAPLVVVQAGGSRRPFFFLHGQWTGSALYSLELARALGPDQAFYLLEPYKFEGLAVPPTFEEVAAAHIEVLRSVQPEGPYLLGGWCNGAIWAYEMARQLDAQGQAVDLLLLMDPDAPAQHKRDRRVITGLGNLLRCSQEKQVDWYLVYRSLRLSFHYWRLNKLKHMRTAIQGERGLERSKANAAPPQPDAFIPRSEVLRQGWTNIYDWMLAGYMPHSYPGRITFFWTEEEPHRREKWRRLIEAKTQANEVEVHIIPGNHITSRTEHLPVLAERLRECLSKAQATLLS